MYKFLTKLIEKSLRIVNLQKMLCSGNGLITTNLQLLLQLKFSTLTLLNLKKPQFKSWKDQDHYKDQFKLLVTDLPLMKNGQHFSEFLPQTEERQF